MKKKIFMIVLCVALVAVCVVSFAACNNAAAENLTFGKELLKLDAQYDILTGLTTAGSCDVGVMDSIMAGYYMNSSSYENTLEVLPFYLSEEEYAIGAKKGNDALIGKINEALIALAANGTVEAIGNEFGVASENLLTATTVNPKANATDNSWTAVVNSGTLIIGYTVFAPIAYTKNTVFTGYDIELARAVVSYLNDTYSVNIEIEFSEINWNAKETLLENGGIDLVWNGMTVTPQRQEGMSLSVSYLANKQAVIIPKADESKYDLTSLDAFIASAKNAIVAVEAGSAAEDVMKK